MIRRRIVSSASRLPSSGGPATIYGKRYLLTDFTCFSHMPAPAPQLFASPLEPAGERRAIRKRGGVLFSRFLYLMCQLLQLFVMV